jgi:hypothetical protein
MADQMNDARNDPEVQRVIAIVNAWVAATPRGAPSHVVMAALAAFAEGTCDACGVTREQFIASINCIWGEAN